jgi:hypothetical protein
MSHSQEPGKDAYPHGRGYGHDYMRGGEVLDGYGYSSRPTTKKKMAMRPSLIRCRTDSSN